MRVGAVRNKAKLEGIGRVCGPMLDGQDDRVLLSTDVEIGISPRVEVTAASERKAGLTTGATVLSRVMHDEDGEIELALQRAQISK